jgi:hypothetical protein
MIAGVSDLIDGLIPGARENPLGIELIYKNCHPLPGARYAHLIYEYNCTDTCKECTIETCDDDDGDGVVECGEVETVAQGDFYGYRLYMFRDGAFEDVTEEALVPEAGLPAGVLSDYSVCGGCASLLPSWPPELPDPAPITCGDNPLP